jgi:hydrogenase maturation protease
MTLAAPIVRLLVCGTADRGDDAAPLAAVARLLPALEPAIRERLEVRRCPQLDPVDLIDVGAGEACVVVDTVAGIAPGSVISLPLDRLAARGAGGTPRSSHALPIEQVLGLAATIRGDLPPGSFVGIGGTWFGFGRRNSKAVRENLGRLQDAISAEIRRLVDHMTAEGQEALAFGPLVPPAVG